MLQFWHVFWYRWLSNHVTFLAVILEIEIAYIINQSMIYSLMAMVFKSIK